MKVAEKWSFFLQEEFSLSFVIWAEFWCQGFSCPVLVVIKTTSDISWQISACIHINQTYWSKFFGRIQCCKFKRWASKNAGRSLIYRSWRTTVVWRSVSEKRFVIRHVASAPDCGWILACLDVDDTLNNFYACSNWRVSFEKYAWVRCESWGLI